MAKLPDDMKAAAQRERANGQSRSGKNAAGGTGDLGVDMGGCEPQGRSDLLA